MSDDTITRLNSTLGGRYRVGHVLGRGASATVYLADDLRHERKVALKVLRPELAAVVGADRFLTEIKTTARLQHPHIVPLFDSGEADSFLFYVMPYVQGETLRARLDRERHLSVNEALDITTKVAEALDYAHSHGLLHRDIKPANILLSRGGPLLSDFGIARALGEMEEDELSRRGFASGTPQYMSLEQMAGDVSLDERSDLYSLACVLYEMLAGEPPHRAASTHGLMRKRLQEPPRLLREMRSDVPEHVGDALRRALEGDRGARIRTVMEFSRELRSAKAQIVVFPIANHSPDDANDWFCDALGVEIMHRLTGVRDLKVVQADAAFRPREGRRVRQLVSDFNASHALIGSARFDDERYKVDVALIRGEDEAELWSHQFVGSLKSGSQFDIQDQIAGAVVRRLPEGLHLVVRSGERPRPEAEPLFWRAQSAWQTRSPEKLLAARDLFAEATTRDPQFARAYVGIASVYTVLAGPDYAARPPHDLYPAARDAAYRALELQPDLGEAHAVLGNCLMNYDWDWEAAERHLRRAIELNPGYSSAHQWYSNYLVYRGRMDEGLRVAKRALDNDSDSKYLRSSLARHHAYRGELDVAIETYHWALEMDPDFQSALIGLALAELHAELLDGCLARVEAMAEGMGQPVPLLEAVRSHALAKLGREDEARRILTWLQTPGPYIPPEFVALAYLGLDDHEHALDWLEIALEQRSHAMPSIAVEPLVAPLKGDPRYEAIVERVHGAPWTSAGRAAEGAQMSSGLGDRDTAEPRGATSTRSPSPST